MNINNSNCKNITNKIIHKKDNTFIIIKNNMPYHVTKDNEEEYEPLLINYNNNKNNKNNKELFVEEKDVEVEKKEIITNLKELKEIKLNELKQNLDTYFYETYPLYKQNNIAIYGTEEEKNEFKKFHDKVVKLYDNITENINKVKTKKELNDIDVIIYNNI